MLLKENRLNPEVYINIQQKVNRGYFGTEYSGQCMYC
jgi:hypothetical protein